MLRDFIQVDTKSFDFTSSSAANHPYDELVAKASLTRSQVTKLRDRET